MHCTLYRKKSVRSNFIFQLFFAYLKSLKLKYNDVSFSESQNKSLKVPLKFCAHHHYIEWLVSQAKFFLGLTGPFASINSRLKRLNYLSMKREPLVSVWKEKWNASLKNGSKRFAKMEMKLVKNNSETKRLDWKIFFFLQKIAFFFLQIKRSKTMFFHLISFCGGQNPWRKHEEYY